MKSSKTSILPPITHENKAIMAIIGIIIFSISYLGIGGHPMLNINNAIITPIDEYIPFLPWTISIYFSHFILVFYAYWYAINHDIATRTFYCYISATIVATIIFILYPTYLNPQPIDSTNLTLLSLLSYKFLYIIDVPFNCLPSLHTTIALIAAYSLKHLENWGNKAYIWSSLIIISTLTTKQHVLLDVIAGIILYFLTVYMYEKFISHYHGNYIHT